MLGSSLHLQRGRIVQKQLSLAIGLILLALIYSYSIQPSSDQTPMALSLEDSKVSSLQKERPTERGISLKTPEPHKTILISTQKKTKSTTTKKYQLLATVTLNEEKQTYKVQFQKPLEGALSLVLAGAEGKVRLSDTQVSFLGSRRPAPHLNRQYFKNDWYRFESGGKAITTLTFEGQSLSQTGTLSLYAQKAF